ncbi:hypothetical protein [Microbacterium sp. Se63.02b]|uniref:hypothetical protein n=1 Tax=Microbacterium sp. Se63.02b TaxID=2709304 RepID=UPI001604D5D2|nr:hypothetical protein [Microbacterium sp. Se63.02b]QNA91953.1 hypothetical protein G4G29_05020 [Microbacterium sp. Se63.02b]
MSQPDITTQQPQGEKKNMSLLIRGSLWIAIGALIAAALVCVVWVLIGDQDGLIGRAFLTILLLAAFAGIAILEAGLAPNRPDWLQLASMVSWIVALLVGAVKIWLPEDGIYFGAERFFQLLLVIAILQLALLHVRLFTAAAQRHVTTFTRVIFIVTITFLAGLVGMLVFFLAFPHTFHYGELYWRIVVALTILVAVGTTLIPLLNALFAPKKKSPAVASPAGAPSWPTYADGITPLPALPDASPDWNAYYTGIRPRRSRPSRRCRLRASRWCHSPRRPSPLRSSRSQTRRRRRQADTLSRLSRPSPPPRNTRRCRRRANRPRSRRRRPPRSRRPGDAHGDSGRRAQRARDRDRS